MYEPSDNVRDTVSSRQLLTLPNCTLRVFMKLFLLSMSSGIGVSGCRVAVSNEICEEVLSPGAIDNDKLTSLGEE